LNFFSLGVKKGGGAEENESDCGSAYAKPNQGAPNHTKGKIAKITRGKLSTIKRSLQPRTHPGKLLTRSTDEVQCEVIDSFIKLIDASYQNIFYSISIQVVSRPESQSISASIDKHCQLNDLFR